MNFKDVPPRRDGTNCIATCPDCGDELTPYEEVGDEPHECTN
ncbi:hypothetical protein RYH80_18000 [Halobaculum sp. MBLA0147]